MDRFDFALERLSFVAAFLSAMFAFTPFHVDFTGLDEADVFAEVLAAVLSLLVYFLGGGTAPKIFPDLKILGGSDG